MKALKIQLTGDRLSSVTISRVDDTFTLASTDAGVAIRYTTDGTKPTKDSTLYSVPVAITADVTVKAKAFKSGSFQSPTSTKSFRLVNTPAISQTNNNVTVTCATEGATIRYTVDGTEPTAESAEYTEAIVLTETKDVKAKAFSGDNSSETATSHCKYKLPLPSVSCTGNTVTITGAEGATMHYTTDGSTPTVESQAYEAPFAITQTVTVKAMAVKNDCTNSNVRSVECTYVEPNDTEE